MIKHALLYCAGFEIENKTGKHVNVDFLKGLRHLPLFIHKCLHSFHRYISNIIFHQRTVHIVYSHWQCCHGRDKLGLLSLLISSFHIFSHFKHSQTLLKRVLLHTFTHYLCVPGLYFCCAWGSAGKWFLNFCLFKLLRM